MTSVWLSARTLALREFVRFIRQRSRVIGAVLPPLLFWFLIGSGLGGSFRYSGGANYLQYFLPGMIVMVVLFTAVFSTISVIEDRREGFLQAVLVAPVPRSGIALGKILGGTALALLQGGAMIAIAPMVGVKVGLSGVLLSVVVTGLVSFGLTGLGFLIAWRMDSSQGFHSVMNLFLMPMWFLSGALFPVEGAPGWLRWPMLLNPLTYGVEGLRRGLFTEQPWSAGGFPSAPLCLAVTCAFCVLMFGLSVLVCRRPSSS